MFPLELGINFLQTKKHAAVNKIRKTHHSSTYNRRAVETSNILGVDPFSKAAGFDWSAHFEVFLLVSVQLLHLSGSLLHAKHLLGHDLLLLF